MSYIRAESLPIEHGPTGRLVDGTLPENPELDMSLDDEILDFVLALIQKVNDLREGQALVVWKQIF
ncbi:hypothetical protein [Streptomyces sp. NPDC003247]|uniref:hypothetical protein n=1 Tax=Streptomyces sp. NPDC003247 TaxID=3364677 RepID=UPI003685A54F